MFFLIYTVYIGIMNIDRGLLCIIYLTILCSYVHTLNDAELKGQFIKAMSECLKNHPVDPSELKNLQEIVPPKSKEGKCLLACVYKSDGTMNAKGLFDVEHAYKMAELAKDGDERRLVNYRKIIEICMRVNEAQVSDGEKGCDRAAMMFKCVKENAPEHGFKI